MKDFHCDMFELRFDFPRAELDEDTLLKEIGVENKEEYIDEDGDLVTGTSFGSQDESADYHAHLRIVLYKEGNSRMDVNYHSSKGDAIEDAKPPYVENFMPWLSKFFKADKFTAHINSIYLFDNSFSPSISLPFPLITTGKALAGALVTGLSIVFPKEDKEKSEMAIIQSAGNGLFLSLNITSEIRLADFDLLSQLKELTPSVNSLVKKLDTRDEKSSSQSNEK